MNSFREESFDECLSHLPEAIREQAATAHRLLRTDPFYSSLPFKAVSRRGNLWSVRVGLSYRAPARRYGEDIVWFWTGTHAEYDQLLRLAADC